MHWLNYQKRKDYQLNILKYQLDMLSYKVKFILMVIEKKLKINNRKKSSIEILHIFDKKYQVSSQKEKSPTRKVNIHLFFCVYTGQ